MLFGDHWTCFACMHLLRRYTLSVLEMHVFYFTISCACHLFTTANWVQPHVLTRITHLHLYPKHLSSYSFLIIWQLLDKLFLSLKFKLLLNYFAPICRLHWKMDSIASFNLISRSTPLLILQSILFFTFLS